MSIDSSITFSFPALTKVIGRPSYHDVALLRKQCYANAKCAGATFGPHGLLGSIMPDDDYIRLSGNAFAAPEDPGFDIDVADRAADNPIRERNHTAQRKRFLLYDSVTNSIRSQLLQAVESKYLDELEDPDLGFGNVPAKDILAHLFTEYGRIGPAELESNLNELGSAWDATGSIAEIWARVKKCRAFATAGGEPIPDGTVIHKLLKVLADTGLYGLTCIRWREMNPNNWTWDNFREDFDAADRNREYQPTATSKGFTTQNAANAATTNGKNSKPSETPTGTNMEGGTVWYYCWSHGLSRNPKHTSHTCQAPKEHHNVNATFEKPEGGSQKVKGQKRFTRPNATDNSTAKPE